MRKIVGLIVLFGFTALMAFNFNTDKVRPSQTIKDDEVGIKFQSITYAEALKLSEMTGKPIFIDCYTVWCGPCKLLAKNTFTDPKVGEFFNKNFISIKVEMERDQEGPELSRLFKIRAYPTLLFINDNGEIIKQSLGYVTPEQLLDVASTVIK